jgi:hypothetical protein
MAAALADYERFPRLEPLPALVRKQRRLEGKISPLEHLVDQEKAVRKDIDVLLLAEGFTRGEGVICNGYDVVHRDRKGQTSLDPVKLFDELVKNGVDELVAAQCITDATDTGDPPQWAEVKPSRGAKVRS